jgi:hypothetical protein
MLHEEYLACIEMLKILTILTTVTTATPITVTIIITYIIIFLDFPTFFLWLSNSHLNSSILF